MISLTLKLLLERRQELSELFLKTTYINSYEEAGKQQLLQVARRALQIIQEWPAEYWPLEDEENIWHDQQDVIAYLQADIPKIEAYQPSNSPTFDGQKFEEWLKVRQFIWGILYTFKPTEEDNDSISTP